MALTGITITELVPIGTDINANDVMAIVNLDIDETQKVTMQNLGNFILGNIANTSNLTVSNLTVSNHTNLNTANISTANVNGNLKIYSGNIYISNTTPNAGIFTDKIYYANGAPWDLQDPVGNAGEVQFNNGNGNFGASNVFTWTGTSNTLSVQNLNLLYANTDTNQGTSQQVLGITDQANQVVGWKTLPTNYMNVYLRDGNVYISSITPVLRTIPIKLRSGGYLEVPAA